MPVMAYSPVGQGGDLLRHPVIMDIARRHDSSSAQICLAWVLRMKGVVAIPKAGDQAHVRGNAAALRVRLGVEDLRALDEAFHPPTRKLPLALL